MMTIGVYYYPEAWPPEQWERDIANIKRFGFEFIHVGEFAWTFMEPEEGQFDFAWLDRVVELAKKHGLKVIMCTPTPTPPIWLVQKHPEVLMVDDAGRTMVHGTRQHATWSSDVYRSYVAKIVTELGRHFGNNLNVWGWQLDNELSHYGRNYDYSEFSQQKFRQWLKAKYGSIENLNRDWGTAFWSQRYQNFDQIRMPNEREYVAQFNHARHARPATLVCHRGRRLSAFSNQSAAAECEESVDHDQLHGHASRSLAGAIAQRSGRDDLDDLSRSRADERRAALVTGWETTTRCRSCTTTCAI